MINVKIEVAVDGVRTCGIAITDKASEEERTLMLCQFFAQVNSMIERRAAQKAGSNETRN